MIDVRAFPEGRDKMGILTNTLASCSGMNATPPLGYRVIPQLSLFLVCDHLSSTFYLIPVLEHDGLL